MRKAQLSPDNQDRIVESEYAHDDDTIDAAITQYFDDCRMRIPDFVAKNFGIFGTFKIHKNAIGRDLILAPLNVFLSIGLFITQLLAWLTEKLGLTSTANWLRNRNFLIPTKTSRYVQDLILEDLFLLSPNAHAKATTLEFDPKLKARLDDDRFQAHIRARLDDYASTRVATSEMAGSLGTIGIGAAGFHSFTPGLLSVVPLVAVAITNRIAASQFFFGERAGALWYSLFPKAASAPTLIGTAVALIVLSSLIVTFAGLFTDPLQVWTGVHEKRLNRLVDSFEAELMRRDSRFPMRELFLARIFDISDSAASAAHLVLIPLFSPQMLIKTRKNLDKIARFMTIIKLRA